MAATEEVCRFLNDYLDIANVPDYPGALNGLQLASSGSVNRIAAAVDACLPVIETAVAKKTDLLIVHHGMFWGGAQRITGGLYRKLQLAFQNDLAVYSAHIPLDVHPVSGNNVLLAKALGFEETEMFLPWKGILSGRRVSVEMQRDELLARLKDVLGANVHIAPGGSEKIREIGIVTGGAGTKIAAAVAEGIDTFVTGEGPHHTYTLAEELGVNLIYGGHYATETFGVRDLAGRAAERFDLSWTFIDHPTGL